MNVRRGSLLLALIILALACGRNETTASKSAAAHREAQAKGIAVGGGHEHGDHHAPVTATGTAEIDHSAHGTGANDTHAGHGMTHGGAADHAAHAPMSAAEHAAMGHGQAAHGATTMTGHDQHASQPHPQHQPTSIAPAHAGHGAMQPAAAAPRIVLSAPTSSSEMASTQPAATLRPDDFDAPAPIAVEEAKKAAGGGGAHEGHDGPQTVFTCPMHPEVTSATPGTCPKCGMALVKKEN